MLGAVVPPGVRPERHGASRQPEHGRRLTARALPRFAGDDMAKPHPDEQADEAARCAGQPDALASHAG